jgi:protein ImuB
MPESSERRYLGVALPLLPAERLRRSSAALPEPLALVARERGRVVIRALDAAGLAEGIAPGMALADARARLPDLAAQPHDAAADAAFLDWLAEGADRYTPMVMAVPPDGLVLDISGCAHLHGGEAALAEDLAARLQRLGLTARLALATTPEAALALARFDVAEVKDLPVGALAASEDEALGLRRAGLKTLARIARQPRAVLAARFGAALVTRLARLLGEEDARITPRRLAPPVSAEQRFAAPLAASEAALAVIETLAVRAGLQLAECHEGGRRFEVALFRSDGHVARLAVDTAAPVRDPKLLIRLLRERIDALADPLDPGFGYDLIRLNVTVTAPLAPEQLRLEGGSLAEAEIGALIDRLGARLGRHRVRRLAAAASHIPEQAAFDLPLANLATAVTWPQRLASEPAFFVREPPWRPLKLFDPPQIIEVLAEVPDGPPRRFRWRQRFHEVTAHEGPERIAAEWWRRADGAGLTRDYYRVEDSAGRRFWLFRHGLYGTEKQSPGWYLHGLFA